MVTGVLLTALDTFVVLWLTRYGIRAVEGSILSCDRDHHRVLPH